MYRSTGCDLEMCACQYCNHSGMMQMKPSVKLKYLMSTILFSPLPSPLPHLLLLSPSTPPAPPYFLTHSSFLSFSSFPSLSTLLHHPSSSPFFPSSSPSFPSSSPSSSYFLSCTSFSSSSYSPLPSSSFSSSSVLSIMRFPTGLLSSESSDIIYRGQSL